MDGNGKDRYYQFFILFPGGFLSVSPFILAQDEDSARKQVGDLPQGTIVYPYRTLERTGRTGALDAASHAYP